MGRARGWCDPGRKQECTGGLDRTDKTSQCPHKGQANYFSIQTKSQTLANAVWSYENPSDGVALIKNHLAFYPGQATVERV